MWNSSSDKIPNGIIAVSDRLIRKALPEAFDIIMNRL